MAIRKIGVEEELMLVDPDTYALTAVSHKAVRAHDEGADRPVGDDHPSDEPAVEKELFLQQIETSTAPCTSVADLETEIRRGRAAIDRSARAAGAIAVAVPAPVLVDERLDVTPEPRYQRIYSEFGEVSRESLACAMHMHIDVADAEEGVAVADRVKPWLPVLLALSANSPFWRGADTGYASWRTEVWRRWPSNGTGEAFGDPATYDEVGRRFVEWGAAFDKGMLYFDARLAQKFPTVEIRVADVCTEVEHAVLVGALARALVETAARDWREDPTKGIWRSDLLRVATWRAARYGISNQIVNPATMELGSVREVFKALTSHVADALDEAGDTALVNDAFERLLSQGNGATRQRSVFEAHGELGAVMKDLAERTMAPPPH